MQAWRDTFNHKPACQLNIFDAYFFVKKQFEFPHRLIIVRKCSTKSRPDLLLPNKSLQAFSLLYISCQIKRFSVLMLKVLVQRLITFDFPVQPPVLTFCSMVSPHNPIWTHTLNSFSHITMYNVKHSLASGIQSNTLWMRQMTITVGKSRFSATKKRKEKTKKSWRLWCTTVQEEKYISLQSETQDR